MYRETGEGRGSVGRRGGRASSRGSLVRKAEIEEA